jgi:hypothetical protein
MNPVTPAQLVTAISLTIVVFGLNLGFCLCVRRHHDRPTLAAEDHTADEQPQGVVRVDHRDR